MKKLMFAVGAMVWAVEAIAQTGATPKPGDAYDYRGFRLGMTLSEFKAAPMIDLDWQDRRAPRGIACSSESSSTAVAQPSEDTRVGAVTCAWITGGDRAFTFAANPSLGKYVAFTHSLQFIAKPGDSEPRLFRMVFSANADAYEDIVRSLSAKFGPSTATESASVQNRLGATFGSEVRIWKNETSVVAAIQRVGQVDRMGLTYTLTSYQQYYDDRVATELRKAPSKL